MESFVPSERSRISIRVGSSMPHQRRPRAFIPAMVRCTFAVPAGVRSAHAHGQQTMALTFTSHSRFPKSSTAAEVRTMGLPHFQQGVRMGSPTTAPSKGFVLRAGHGREAGTL